MNEETDDEIYELYARFRRELSEGNFNEFYDADDLIDIFDKATDYNDDYVRLEVLLRGQQYHPGNEELRVRRGFLYLDFEIEEGARGVTASPAGRNPLRTILKLRTQVGTLDPQDAKLKLERLIDFTEVIDPETAVQLVECVSHYGLADWFRKILPRLRRKADDLPDLLDQSVLLFMSAADYQTAIKLTEDLIEISPFESNYWHNLAECYLKLKQPEQALNAIEYALAIDALNIRSLFFKGCALSELNRYGEVVELLLPHVGALLADKLTYFKALTDALLKTGQKERAFEILKAHATAHPDQFGSIDSLLRHQAPDISEFVYRYFECEGIANVELFIGMANDFYNEGNYYAAHEMYAVLDRMEMLPMAERGFDASALYLMRRYDRCAALLREHLVSSPAELTLDICAAGLLSMCRLRRFDDARETLEILNSIYPFKLESQWRIGTNLARLGIRYLLVAIEEQLRNPDHFDINMVDIFEPPVTYNSDTI